MEIKLATPITVKGAEPIRTITLRKPTAGELRGLSLTMVMQMGADTMFKLIPRISSPALTTEQMASLGADDYTALCTATLSFFMKKEEMAQLEIPAVS